MYRSVLAIFLFLFQNSSDTYWRGICDDTGFCSLFEECHEGCLCQLPFNRLESIFFSCAQLPFSMCFVRSPRGLAMIATACNGPWTMLHQTSFAALIYPLVLVPARWLQLCHQILAIRCQLTRFPGTPYCAHLSGTCLTSSSLDSAFHHVLLQMCQLHRYN